MFKSILTKCEEKISFGREKIPRFKKKLVTEGFSVKVSYEFSHYAPHVYYLHGENLTDRRDSHRGSVKKQGNWLESS